MEKSLLRISELAKKADVLASTVRHYTDIGLVRPVMETQGGHRLYDEAALGALRRVQLLAKRGRTLEEIKSYFEQRSRVRTVLLVEDDAVVVDFIRSVFDSYSGKPLPLHADQGAGESPFPEGRDPGSAGGALGQGDEGPGGVVLPQVRLEVAAEGFAAGRRCADLMPDLVILDLMLPGINGFMVCKAIRQDPELGSLVKILAITGYDTPANKAAILDAGADGYLAKPFTLEEFAASLKSLGLSNEKGD